MTCNNPPLPSYRCSYRFWSSGSPSRARAARQHLYSPTAPPSQPTTSTGPRSQTPPPRPWPWPNLTPMTFTRSPGLSLRVGVSTSVQSAAGSRGFMVSVIGRVNTQMMCGRRRWSNLLTPKTFLLLGHVQSSLLRVFRKAALLKSALIAANRT